MTTDRQKFQALVVDYGSERACHYDDLADKSFAKIVKLYDRVSKPSEREILLLAIGIMKKNDEYLKWFKKLQEDLK